MIERASFSSEEEGHNCKKKKAKNAAKTRNLDQVFKSNLKKAAQRRGKCVQTATVSNYFKVGK